MFGKRVTLFTLVGFEVRVDASWAILAMLMIWSLARGYFPYKYPQHAAGVPAGWRPGAEGLSVGAEREFAQRHQDGVPAWVGIRRGANCPGRGQHRVGRFSRRYVVVPDRHFPAQCFDGIVSPIGDE